MTSSRWDRIKALFERVLAAPDGESRQAILSAVPPDLAEEVLRLMDLHERAEGFLDRPLSDVERLRSFGDVLHPGQLLNQRFEIRRLRGCGGMGQVYEAFDRDLQQAVAVKVVNEGYAGRRFISEIQAARRVTHPNVCRIFDIERHEDLVFCTMELLEGETLASTIKRGPIPIAPLIVLGQQVCAALAAAHDAGILHRDLKPANVMVEPNGRAVITDFGLAQPIYQALDASQHTAEEQIAGTLSYMAPEVLAGYQASARSDIYSLGILLYEAATGQLPFESAGPLASVMRRSIEMPVPPSSLNREVPRGLDEAILACIRPDAAKRPPTAREVMELMAGRRVLSRRKALLWSSGAAAGVSLLALGSRYIIQEARPNGIRGVLLAFQNPGETPQPHLAEMKILLRQQLQQSSRIDALSDERVDEILKLMQRSNKQALDVRTEREVALRNGATLVLYASISRVGPGFRLDLLLEEPRRPDYAPASWDKQFRATGEQDLLSQARDAAVWVRQVAGESQKEIDVQNRSPEEITTGSWDALTLFRSASEKRWKGDLADAESLLKQAIVIDPKFPSATRDLADVLVSERKYKEGYQAWDAALEASRTRLLNSRERFRIEASYADDVGDLDKAESVNKDWIANYPFDYFPHFLLGNVYFRLNRMAEATGHMMKASQLRPQEEAVELNLTYHYLAQGNFGEARKRIDVLRRIGRAYVADEAKGKAHFIWGNVRQSEQCFERMMASEGPLLHRAALLSASCLSEQGRFGEASERLRVLIQRDEAAGAWQLRAQKLVYLAELARCESRMEEAVEYARLALTLDSGDFVQELAGVLLARCGAVQESADALAAVRALPKLPRTERRTNRLEGEIALQRKDWTAAIKHLEEAARHTTMWDLNDSLARGREMTGQMKEALAERVKLASAKGFLWTAAERVLPGAWASNVSELVALASRMGRTHEVAEWSKRLFEVRSSKENQYGG
jgi:serine/threonine protein kinase/Tfp pilus assembly protein PilF